MEWCPGYNNIQKAACLHSEGEMAALGVPDDAGVHRGLHAPAPLQVSHSVLVQVTRQHRGKPRTHASGGQLEPTLTGHEAEVKQKGH